MSAAPAPPAVVADVAGAAPAVAAAPAAVRIWDLPTRVFHWSLAALVVAAVVTAKLGGNAMDWHVRIGMTIGALLAFRIVWGLVGGRWSRFSAFLYAPATTWNYLRGRVPAGAHHDVGHSPLGALSVFALLAVLVVQVSTGLVADDEIATSGPLAAKVASATSAAATRWHRNVGQWLVLGLVGLHLAAIAWYSWRRRGLVLPMWHGDKALDAGVPAARDDTATRLLALAIAAACGIGAAAIAPRRQRLIAGDGTSMRRRAGKPPIDLRRPAAAAELAQATTIFREYGDSLDIDLAFQDFDAELAGLPGEYAPPQGELLLAFVAGELAGCGALRPIADCDYANACEMKRLYVKPAYRGHGLGRILAEALLDAGRRAGYSAMLLDTLDAMESARELYATLGFVEIPPYYFNPIPGAHYLKADLT